MNEAPLRLAAVERRYRTEAGELPVLLGADLTIAAGEIVALVAPSGTGKSTLLHLAGLLEKPDGGEVFIAGQAAGSLSSRSRSAGRGAVKGWCIEAQPPVSVSRANIGKSTTQEKCIVLGS